jgi:putative SOS response-associated peptidase YedK
VYQRAYHASTSKAELERTKPLQEISGEGSAGRREAATGDVPKSCTMLITEPNDFVPEVHDRISSLLRNSNK